MKHILWTACCLLLLLLQAVVACGQQLDEAQVAKQRAEASSQLARKHAAEYAIHLAEASDAELKLQPDAVLKFTNPVAQEAGGIPQELYGGVFVWNHQGCPEVVAAIFKVYSPGPPFVIHELTSLSDHRVVAKRDGDAQWRPDRAAVQRLPVPDAPQPSGTAVGRLAQMRAMARQFAANKTDGRNRTTELRLLSRPLYRYESTDPAVADGALFAFADGTDPEVLLLLEARRGGGADRWHFAAARLNILHVKLFHQERQVWQAPYLTRTEWQNPAAPYMLIRHEAGGPAD